jgi:hypothetical protein
MNIKQSNFNKFALSLEFLMSLAGLWIQIHIDLHYFRRPDLDPNPLESEKLDPNPDPH